VAMQWPLVPFQMKLQNMTCRQNSQSADSAI
jgi:hypothetical protein